MAGDWTKYRILTDASNAFLKNKILQLEIQNQLDHGNTFEPLDGYIKLAENLFGKKGTNLWDHGTLVQKIENLNVQEFSEL